MEKCWLDGRTLAGQSGVGWLESHQLDKGVLIARSAVDWMETWFFLLGGGGGGGRINGGTLVGWIKG